MTIKAPVVANIARVHHKTYVRCVTAFMGSSVGLLEDFRGSLSMIEIALAMAGIGSVVWEGNIGK